MTSTLFKATPETPVRTPPPATGRRMSRALMLGTLVALVGAAIGGLAYAQAVRGEPVVAMSRAVPFGATITTDDLREVTIPAGTTLRAIDWSERQVAVGRVATTDLAADQLLSPDNAGAPRMPRPGDAIIGIPVAPGRLPATGLSPRDEVLVLRPNSPVAPVRATVLGVGDPGLSGRRTVDVLIPQSAVDAVAAAASDDTTMLVLVAGR